MRHRDGGGSGDLNRRRQRRRKALGRGCARERRNGNWSRIACLRGPSARCQRPGGHERVTSMSGEHKPFSYKSLVPPILGNCRMVCRRIDQDASWRDRSEPMYLVCHILLKIHTATWQGQKPKKLLFPSCYVWVCHMKPPKSISKRTKERTNEK